MAKIDVGTADASSQWEMDVAGVEGARQVSSETAVATDSRHRGGAVVRRWKLSAWSRDGREHEAGCFVSAQY